MRLALVLVMSAAALAAQQRDRPTTPIVKPVDSGTALVAGIVTASATSETPVRRAIVTLVSTEGGDGTAAVTDEQGRFVIQGVAEGRYFLSAQKPAHLTNNYGAKRPGRPGVTLVIAKNQRIEDLRIPLPRGGVITGRLTLPTGEPMRNVEVTAVPMSQATAGGRLNFLARAFRTDDRGVYRIYGLVPDEYLVAAIAAVGRGDIEQRPDAGYDEAIRILAQPAMRPGDPVKPDATVPPRLPRVGYAPTYYPGTPVAANASAVRVGIGEVKDGIDIPITLVPMTTVTGTVRDVNGQPTQTVTISVDTVGPPLPATAVSSARTNRPDPQGRFEITNLPPGSYRISARGGGVTIAGDTTTIRNDAQVNWAQADVQTSGENIEGVALNLQPGLTFSGRVDTGGAPVATLTGTIVALTARRVGSTLAPSMPSRSSAVAEDGSFTVTGLQPGDYEVAVTLPTALRATWAIASVTAGGPDLRDRPLTLADGSISGVTIGLTDRRTEVAGTLTTATGQAASDYYIVIFPSDRALWHPLSPRVRVVRPGADGGYSARDLPPGDYRIAAVTDVEDNEWHKGSFLESLLEASIAAAVKAGTSTRQDIRIQR
jgi:hypothetical protein